MLGGATLANADFFYSDFSSTSGLTLNGTAEQFGSIVRLTHDEINGEAGNMWFDTEQSVQGGFSTEFEFRCDGVGTIPADGVAFGIQNQGSNTLGVGGGDNGMGGIQNSVYVNFQSFWNAISLISVDQDGNQTTVASTSFSGLHRTDPWLANISYDGTTKSWNVLLDGSTVLTANFDMDTVLNYDNSSEAYVGIGGGTGLGYDNNDVHSWRMTATPEPSSLLALLGAFGVKMLRRKR